ncbi:MAG: 4-alpha-glucanotransferase [Elusimicrobiaceae bacterium]|jgi:4-alpha-glucanotransferase
MPSRLKNHPALKGRHAGILIPLFSMRSESDWGIGDFASMCEWLKWLSSTGTKILQILPIHENGAGENCPYAALTAFALDPIYIAVEQVPDVIGSAAAQKVIKHDHAHIGKLRAEKSVLYSEVRDLKMKVLRMGFEDFYRNEYLRETGRAGEFRDFVKRTSWLFDYASFRAMKDEFKWSSWTTWTHGLREHDRAAILSFRKTHEKTVLFYEYLQWIAAVQWERVRLSAADCEVWLFGDLPFMVNQESSDVWANQDVFNIHAEIGAPPDQFSPDGQKWGLPAYNWETLEKTHFAWWRERVRRAIEIYDIYRLDHLVGFFRTWIIPRDKTARAGFDIEGDAAQQSRGERFLKAVIEESGKAFPIAEDLGVIPKFVRASLTALSVPGYKIPRWEKDEQTNLYRDPDLFDPISVAVASTHDSETMRDWWDSLHGHERYLFWLMVSRGEQASPMYDDRVHEHILGRILGAGSAIALFQLQDIIAMKERVNVPGTVGSHNWTYRTPYTAAVLNEKFADKIAVYKRLLKKYGRSLFK